MKLAFVGDSLTYGWMTEGAAIWTERYAPLGARCFGVAGDCTDDVLQRIQGGQLDGEEPELIVLLVGTNDLGSGRSPEETARGVAACVRALRSRVPGARIVVLGLLPRGDGGKRGYVSVAATNEQLALFADGEKVQFADLTPAFVDPAGSVRPDCTTRTSCILCPRVTQLGVRRSINF